MGRIREPCIRWGLESPKEVHFVGTYSTLTYQDMPAVDVLSVRPTRYEAGAMRPLATVSVNLLLVQVGV